MFLILNIDFHEITIEISHRNLYIFETMILFSTSVELVSQNCPDFLARVFMVYSAFVN